MFHKNNFGSFSGELERFADMQGYIPEIDDDYSDMSYDGAIDWDEESWAEFVEDAVAATKRAQAALSEWQAAN